MIKNLIKDMTKYLPSIIAPAIAGLIALPIITRLFSPTDYGNYILVTTTVSLISSVAIGWLDSIVRFFPVYEAKAKLGEFYNTTLIFSAISIIVMSLLFLSVLFLIKDGISANLFSLMSLGVSVFIATSCFQVFRSFLRVKRQVVWYSYFTVWHSMAGLCIGVVLVFLFHLGIEGLLWGKFLSIAIILPLLYSLSIGMGVSIRKGVSIPMASEMARYGFPMMVTFFTFWFLSFSDRYILEFFRGSEEVGIYSVSYGLSEMTITSLLSVFIMASGPISMHIWEKQGSLVSQEFLTKLTRYIILICLPAVVGLSLLAKPIISVMAATAYYKGYKIIPIIAFGFFFNSIAYSFALVFGYVKRTYISMIAAAVSAFLNLGLNFLLIPKYGYTAAAITTLICYSVYLFLMVIFSRRFLVWKFPFKSLVKVTCASVIMAIILYPIGNSLTSSALINLIVAISVGVIVYSIMLFLLGGFQKNEIDFLLALGRKVIRH